MTDHNSSPRAVAEPAIARPRHTALGVASLAFGFWYALGALTFVPYVL